MTIENPDRSTQELTAWSINVSAMNALGSTGDIGKMLFHLPMLNSLAMPVGVGSVTFARASIGTYIDPSDGLRKIAVVDEPRFEGEGLLMEGAGTNNALHAPDLSDVVWVKPAGTGVKDAVGRDGVGSSASTFTATAGNATCLQAVTIGSAEQTYAVAIKRKTGTGTVEITMDNGATWTDITAFLGTTDWYEAQISQTLANPTFGFRLGTAGDAIYVDENQLESLPFASSYIPTAAIAVTRAADACEVTIAGNVELQANPGTMLCDVDVLGFAGGSATHTAIFLNGETNRRILPVNSGSGDVPTGLWGPNNINGSTPLTPGVTARLAVRHGGNGNSGLWQDGVELNTLTGQDVSDALGAEIHLGHRSGASHLWGHLANVRIYNRALSDREMAVA